MTDVSHSGDYEIVGIAEDAEIPGHRGPAYANLSAANSNPPESPFVAGSVPSSCMCWQTGDIESLSQGTCQCRSESPVLNMMSFGEQVAHNFNQEHSLRGLRSCSARSAHPGLRRAVWRNSYGVATN